MRFPEAWASIASQNSVLRVAVIGVTISGLLALMISLKFAFKDPLIIERGCYSTVKGTSPTTDATQDEYVAFIKATLAQRFDSDANIQGDLISLEELGNRSQEQEELKRRNVRQKVIVNSVVKKEDAFVIDADRVYSVGTLRSALSFPLLVKVQKANRTFSNPYGLVLLKVSAQSLEGEKKNDGR